MTSATTIDGIEDTGLVAIVRGVSRTDAPEVVSALAEGGVTTIEVTADTPGTIETIRHLSGTVGEDVLLGAGTVLDAETARAAHLAGAEYVVTPTVKPSVIETCNRYGVPVVPGIMTPTEAQTAIEAGADMCKLFPASTVGPDHVSAIHGPLPQVPLVPTGGITLDNAEAFLEAGAVALGVGSALVDTDAIEAGDYGRLTERAADFRDLVAEARR